MSDDVSWVPLDVMEKFMFDTFRSVGVPEPDSKICADVLITADKWGFDSHGVSRLKPIYIDRIRAGLQKPVTKIDLIRDGPTTAILDGNNGMGMVISTHAMNLCIQKAKGLGMGMVAVRNSTHYGSAGYYANLAVNEGMIGITGTNTRPAVAPTRGVENMLGTNPLTFGIPTDEEFPFLMDSATSIIQRGKVEVYAREGKKLPEGLVMGSDGRSKTDPEEVLADLVRGEAALLPLGGLESTGGYKGYGYATVVEILSAALQGGPFLKALTGVNLGHFFIAIDVSAFTDLNSFRKTTGDILRSLRASKKMPGEKRILTAGEREYLTWMERKMKGVPLNRSLQKEIMQLRNELNLTSYNFHF